MVDLVELLLQNEPIRFFLSSVAISAGKDTAEKTGKWIVESLVGKIRRVPHENKTKLAEAEKSLKQLTAGGQSSGLVGSFWLDFLEFMFPERPMGIDDINPDLSEYVAGRIYAGLGFQQLLYDLKFEVGSVKYMSQYQGRRSQGRYYFDLAALYSQEYYDHRLMVRVVDARESVPTLFVKALPTVVQDINGEVQSNPIIQNHDTMVIIQTGRTPRRQLENLREAVRTTQADYDFTLPRLVLLTHEELSGLLELDTEERVANLREKLQSAKLARLL